MNESNTNPLAANPRQVTVMTNAARFPLGQIVATPGALALLERTGFSAAALLSRHLQGDWGDCCAEDRTLNELSLAQGMRLMSVYRLVDAEKLAATPVPQRARLPTVWIITEWDRSYTTLLRPDEY